MKNHKLLKIKPENVRATIKNNKIEDPISQIREFWGAFPGKVKNISIDFYSHKNIDFIVVAGDDGGITTADIDRLEECLDKNSNKGHGEHGVGFRVAARDSVLQINKLKLEDKKFYITDGNKGIEFYITHNSDIGYIENNTKNKWNDIFSLFKSELDKLSLKKNVTKLIIPVSYKNDKEISKNIEFEIKKTWHKQIINDNLSFFYKGKKIKVKYSLTDNNISSFKKWHYKYLGKGQKRHVFEFRDYLFSNDKIELNKEEKEDFLNNDNHKELVTEIFVSYKYLDNGMFPYKSQKDCPEDKKRDDERKNLMDEYGIDKTKLSGVLILSKDVPITTQFVYACGMGGGRGTNSYEQFIFTCNIKDNNDKKVCNSRWEKTVKPKLLKEYNAMIGTLYIYLKNKKMNIMNNLLIDTVLGEEKDSDNIEEYIEDSEEDNKNIKVDIDYSIATTTTVNNEGEQKIKQDTNQYIRHLKPGGYLYLYSVDCSGWKIKEGKHKGEQLLNHGAAYEGRIEGRLIEHQQQHPQDKLVIHWVYYVPTNVIEEETAFIALAQKNNIHWSSPYTRKSEWVINKEKCDEIMKQRARSEWKKVPNPEKFLDRCGYEKTWEKLI